MGLNGARVSWWGALFGSRRDDGQRLAALTDAIEESPASAVNYVLRGELYLRYDEPTLAQVDFERALAIAHEEAETHDWGFIAQALRDRALAGWQTAIQRGALMWRDVHVEDGQDPD